MKYLLYVRKSSESEDKQVQSIDDQLAAMRAKAVQLGLEVVDELIECKSAKNPGGRPIFEQMLEMLQLGSADAILTWNVNRLSRNPVDSGKIQWLLQQETIKEIRTVDRVFLPGDNAIVLSVETSQANQFIRDHIQVVTRGMRSKALKGWRPNPVPQGYFNDRLTATIVSDPERTAMLRQAWELLLSGAYSVPSILRIMNDDWQYLTPRGNKLMLGGLCKMFHNRFYAGWYFYAGTLTKGNHEAIITMEEFAHAQKVLGTPRSAETRSEPFAYSGLMSCAGCGRLICGTRKSKWLKSEERLKTYTYYYCANSGCLARSKNSITELQLEETIEAELAKVAILPEFKELAFEGIRRWKEEQEDVRDSVQDHQHDLLAKKQGELDRLIGMRISGELESAEFLPRKQVIQSEIVMLRENRGKTDRQSDRTWETVEQAVEFAASASSLFASGDARTKFSIARTLGAKYVLRPGALEISPNELLIPILEDYASLEHDYLALEPTYSGSDSTKRDIPEQVRLQWWT